MASHVYCVGVHPCNWNTHWTLMRRFPCQGRCVATRFSTGVLVNVPAIVVVCRGVGAIMRSFSSWVTTARFVREPDDEFHNAQS